MSTKVKFESLGGRLVKIPVVINGTIQTSFLLDTGAGVNVISERLCTRIGCRRSGSYTGKRMSGEEITLEFTTIPQISVGNSAAEDVRAGVLDIFEKLPEELGVIDGALSLRFFENQVFTIDYPASEVIIGGQPSGASVPITIERDHEKVIAFIGMSDFGFFEIDTGNSMAVLNLPKASIAKIDLTSSSIKKVEGKNETGFPFVSYYAAIPELRTAAGDIIQKDPKVAFKKLIHDGVIGNDFFKGKRVTFDIAHKELRFH
ncbi:MAG: retropepsin-like aspartic protease [Bdellovibrionales bacterium]